MNKIQIDNYKIYLNKILGKGNFGEVYLTKNILNNNYYATKVEKIILNKKSQLLNELNVYKKCNKYINVYYSYKDNKNVYIIIDLFNINLNTYIEKMGKISLKYTIFFSLLILKQIQYYHSFNIVHRDIKPGNFLIDKNNNNIILIDFGLSYNINDTTFIHENKYIGTARYMSINALEKKQQTKIDDLISIGYVILFIFYGALFWFDINNKDKQQRNVLIYKIKKNLKNTDLVFNFKCKNCLQDKKICNASINLLKYFNYLDKLIETKNYEPDYDYIYSLFYNIVDFHNFNFNNISI
jgi:serine/threonine protein kinase